MRLGRKASSRPPLSGCIELGARGAKLMREVPRMELPAARRTGTSCARPRAASAHTRRLSCVQFLLCRQMMSTNRGMDRIDQGLLRWSSRQNPCSSPIMDMADIWPWCWAPGGAQEAASVPAGTSSAPGPSCRRSGKNTLRNTSTTARGRGLRAGQLERRGWRNAIEIQARQSPDGRDV